MYMLYQLKRPEIGQHDLVTIYVSVIRPVLEYACPVWHTKGSFTIVHIYLSVHRVLA